MLPPELFGFSSHHHFYGFRYEFLETQLEVGELRTGVCDAGDLPGENIVGKVPGDRAWFATGERKMEPPLWYGDSGEAIGVFLRP